MDKAANKQVSKTAKITLPKMDWPTFLRLVNGGIREFHNGGERRRHVVGIDIFMVLYKSKPGSRSTSGILKDKFVNWCRGYVKDGVMYDITGKEVNKEK